MSDSRPRLQRLQLFPNGELGVVWLDGAEHHLTARFLRANCPCAECVDELSGQRRLDPSRIPQDLRARGWSPVGSYGISIEWSDGHRAGIYTFERLRLLADAAG